MPHVVEVMYRCVLRIMLCSLVLLATCLLTAAGARAAEVDFNRDIRPILAETCFPCHGFDENSREADLRLDTAEGAFADRGGYAAIVAGKLDESEAWRRINSDDPAEQMPPPDSNLSLSPADKELVKQWIEQGARYAGHWSFIAPVRPEVPALPAELQPQNGNEIDAFIRAQLSKHQLQPAPEADRYTLIRRVTLDLTGLPPTAEEVAAFVADKDPKAYDNLVTRLLNSSHFGEQMARDWLDATRYADTNGFSIDGGRHMWLWRDWVIQAFNDNMPYDQFLVEQLAGDLLEQPSPSNLIATGMQRNNMVTHEGGTIPEENLTNYNVDRVKTLGEAVLGLTVGCAQCHDHKYDPISQKDYYQLYAFFNTLDDRGLDGNSGINPAPTIMAKTVLQTDELESLEKQIAALEQQLHHTDVALLSAWRERELAKLATRGRDFALHPVQVLKVSTPNRGAGFDMEGTNGVRLKDPGDLGAFDISTELPKIDEPITGFRVVFHPLPEFPGGGWGTGKNLTAESGDKGTFVLTAIAATADVVPGDQVNLHKLQPYRGVTASSWLESFPAEECLDPRRQSGWSPDPSSEGPVHLTATFERPIRATDTPYLTVQVNFGFGRAMMPGRLELFAITGEDDGTNLPPAILPLVQLEPSQLTDEQRAQLWKYCAAHADELAAARIDLANLRERREVLTKPFPTMVMNVAEKPRETHILHRGDYSQPREVVTAGTPESLPPLPEGAAANRLGLARWLTMPTHPLTSRVAVNRTWKMLMGTGLVATPADFGAQGQWPSHPELLDWLAVDFVEHGWDVKRLVRQIVSSATYRQSSMASEESLQADPSNRWLARGPRFRMPAEMIRDSALKISGLLVPRIGGPSVNPYTPGDLWREVSHYGSTPATAQTFVQDHGEKLYRRSLYTYWKRTAPPPNMTAFDAPNREVCVVERPETTTPLQALVLLNDVQFVEASRAFAERIMAHGDTTEQQLQWAYLTALARPPSAEEVAVLEQTLQREQQRYANDPAAALAYLQVGESPRNEQLPVEQHAAWSQIAALLLNLSETITRN